MIRIIAISGKAESGKTYAANILKNIIPNSRILPLASELKRIAREAGWNGEKDEKGRAFLQELGGVLKRYHGMDYFAKMIIETVKYWEKSSDIHTVIVDDLRMPEELKAFSDFCSSTPSELVTVRVERPNYENALTPEQREDRSETGLDDVDFAYTLINHGDKSFDVSVADFAKRFVV